MVTRTLNYVQALREALKEEMTRDEMVVLLGEDVGAFGGVYGVTSGLYSEFGRERVIDTPISEDGFTGAAVGMAIMGLRPVVEIMYPDFLPSAMNQLVNLAAKVETLFNGKVKAPLVVRTTIIQGRSSGGDHAQVMIPIFMHVPGFQVIAPATPMDAKGLLKSAIRSRKLTVFFEAASLYATKGPVPEEEYLVPIGKAEVVREGSDVTIVTFSDTVRKCLAVSEAMKSEVECEVIDLKTLSPLDRETVARSVAKTGRLVTVEGSWGTCGVGAEVVALMAEKGGARASGLRFARVSPPQSPEPMSPPLVKEYIVTEKKIEDAVRSVRA